MIYTYLSWGYGIRKFRTEIKVSFLSFIVSILQLNVAVALGRFKRHFEDASASDCSARMPDFLLSL
jgi:hypothetical protein